MEQRYLIDTNVIIDYLGNKLPLQAQLFIKALDINISAVTQIEVLGWPGATEQQLMPLMAFIKLTSILPIHQAVIEKTIHIRQSKKLVLAMQL